MVLTASKMTALGTDLPAFELPDTVSGRNISPGIYADKSALLVMFICAHCPYVKHIQDGLAQLGKDYVNRIGLIAISANDVEQYPDDAPGNLRRFALDAGWPFPLCYDETQTVAREFEAACTPDFFLYDAKRNLVYRGQLDDSRPGNDIPVTGKALRAAIEAVLSGATVSTDQKPSVGCNIKWKSV